MPKPELIEKTAQHVIKVQHDKKLNSVRIGNLKSSLQQILKTPPDFSKWYQSSKSMGIQISSFCSDLSNKLNELKDLASIDDVCLKISVFLNQPNLPENFKKWIENTIIQPLIQLKIKILSPTDIHPHSSVQESKSSEQKDVVLPKASIDELARNITSQIEELARLALEKELKKNPLHKMIERAKAEKALRAAEEESKKYPEPATIMFTKVSVYGTEHIILWNADVYSTKIFGAIDTKKLWPAQEEAEKAKLKYETDKRNYEEKTLTVKNLREQVNQIHRELLSQETQNIKLFNYVSEQVTQVLEEKQDIYTRLKATIAANVALSFSKNTTLPIDPRDETYRKSIESQTNREFAEIMVQMSKDLLAKSGVEASNELLAEMEKLAQPANVSTEEQGSKSAFAEFDNLTGPVHTDPLPVLVPRINPKSPGTTPSPAIAVQGQPPRMQPA